MCNAINIGAMSPNFNCVSVNRLIPYRKQYKFRKSIGSVSERSPRNYTCHWCCCNNTCKYCHASFLFLLLNMMRVSCTICKPIKLIDNTRLFRTLLAWNWYCKPLSESASPSIKTTSNAKFAIKSKTCNRSTEFVRC